jgi:hypothetical protein
LSVFSPEDGRLLRKIGKPYCFEDAHETRTVNSVFAEVGEGDNIYVAFEFRNRIDKYTAGGDLLFSFDRPVNYEVLERAEWIEDTRRRISNSPRFTTVSKGIAIDNKERIWVMTANRSFTQEEWQRMSAAMDRSGENPEDQKNIYDFHIFNTDGIFLGSIPFPVNWLECKFRIFGDRLFLIEQESETCVHEYRIVGL